MPMTETSTRIMIGKIFGMGSATEENKASYLDETDVVDDGTILVSFFMTPQTKLGLLPFGNNAADVLPAVERFSTWRRRVVVKLPWRVRDLVIPSIAATSSRPEAQKK